MQTAQVQSPHETRPSWRSLFERDLDLIILDLLHSSRAFQAWLLERVASDLVSERRIASFAGAWHSVIDSLGHESDLEAEWLLSDGDRFTLLIEDKIDARCQPDQALRYRARAARYLTAGRSAYARTLLIAPDGYPLKHREDTAPFENYLSIEEIAEW